MLVLGQLIFQESVLEDMFYALCCQPTPQLQTFSSLWMVTYQENWTGLFALVYTQMMEKAMAPHSSTLDWEILWIKESSRLQSMGSRRVGHDLTFSFTFTFHFHVLEKEMATHSSVLAWRIPGMGAWWAAVDGVSQSWTWLTRLRSSMHRWSGCHDWMSFWLHYSDQRDCFWMWVYLLCHPQRHADQPKIVTWA